MELYFGETLLIKDSKNYSSEKKRNYIFLLELYFGETLLIKDSKNYSSEKKGTIFFLELYFGETRFRFHFSS